MKNPPNLFGSNKGKSGALPIWIGADVASGRVYENKHYSRILGLAAAKNGGQEMIGEMPVM